MMLVPKTRVPSDLMKRCRSYEPLAPVELEPKPMIRPVVAPVVAVLNQISWLYVVGLVKDVVELMYPAAAPVSVAPLPQT